jgi:PAS domain-containing protein
MAFKATEPLPLHHSWPLSERARHFDLGCILNCAVTDVIEPVALGALPPHHAGCWECDLSDDALTWSGGVYDIFGLPRGAQVSRREVLGFYADESRAAMERLRAHAIEHRRGFTLDVQILPAIGKRRRMRLIAAPISHGDRVVPLEGLKFLI